MKIVTVEVVSVERDAIYAFNRVQNNSTRYPDLNNPSSYDLPEPDHKQILDTVAKVQSEYKMPIFQFNHYPRVEQRNKEVVYYEYGEYNFYYGTALKPISKEKWEKGIVSAKESIESTRQALSELELNHITESQKVDIQVAKLNQEISKLFILNFLGEAKIELQIREITEEFAFSQKQYLETRDSLNSRIQAQINYIETADDRKMEVYPFKYSWVLDVYMYDNIGEFVKSVDSSGKEVILG